MATTDTASLNKALSAARQTCESLQCELDSVRQVRERLEKEADGLKQDISALEPNDERFHQLTKRSNQVTSHLTAMEMAEQELVVVLREHEERQSDLQRQLDDATRAP